MGKLTDLSVKAAETGRLFDGDGLMLDASKPGHKFWAFRYTSPTRRADGSAWRRELGIGPYPQIKLAKAREAARAAQALVSSGVDPIDARKTEKAAKATPRKPVPTFGEIAATVVADAHTKTTNQTVRDQWTRHLSRVFCGPIFDKPVNAVTAIDVAGVLTPVWHKKPELSRKLLPAIRRVFEKARIIMRDEHGETLANPALWPDLKALGFEAPKKLTKGHQPSLPYAQTATFVALLRDRGTIPARLLEFIILTNVRAGAGIDAEWRQFDLDAKLWVVPLENMKDRRSRREPFPVPLCDRAVEIVREMRERGAGSGYVFPGRHGGRMSGAAMIETMKKLHEVTGGTLVDPATGRRAVVHGFRSTFRVWAEETTAFRTDVIEDAMGHAVGTAAQRAYRRTTMLEKRRELMDVWGRYVGAKGGANVVAFPKTGGASA